MADTLPSSKHSIRNLLPVLMGAGIALCILFILQYWVRGGPPGDVIPYEEVLKPYSIRHTRAEFWGILIGVFTGSLLISLVFPRPRLVQVLWIAVLVVAVIAISSWPFALQKEIIIFALPLWMIISLLGFYSSRFLNRKRK
jgi:hypothetical protein